MFYDVKNNIVSNITNNHTPNNTVCSTAMGKTSGYSSYWDFGGVSNSPSNILEIRKMELLDGKNKERF